MNRVHIGLLAGLVGVAAVAAPRAQDPFKAALPESTSLYVAAPNIKRWFEGFKNTALYKIWREEEVQEFFADALAELDKQVTQGLGMAKAMHEQGQLPIDPEKLYKTLTQDFNGIAFAITDLQMPAGQETPGRVGMMLSIDFGKGSKVVQDGLAMLAQIAVAQSGGKVSLTNVKVGEVAMSVMKPPAGGPTAMVPHLGAAWGFVNGRLVLGTDVKRTEQVIKAMSSSDNAPAKSMVASEAYQTFSRRTSANRSDLEFYMKPASLIATCMSGLRFAAMMNPEIGQKVDVDGVARVIDVLGLNGLKSLGFSSGYNGEKGYFKSFVDAPAAERKGLLAIGGGSVDQNKINWIPKDVASFSIANFGNLEKIYTVAMDAVKAYDPGVHELVKGKLGEVEGNLELSLQKDVFGAFRGDLVTYSKPMQAMLASPAMVFMLGCPKPDRTVHVLKKLCALSDGMFSINESAGDDAKFYTVDIMLDDMGGMDPTGIIDPTFTFKDGMFVFGLSRQDVKDALNGIAGKGGDSVKANPAFKPFANTIPEKVNSLSFSDVAATVDGVYGQLSGVLGIVPIPADVPIDLGLLPSVETITKHLFGSVSWARTDDAGIYGEAVGPFGPELVVGLGAGVAVGVGVLVAMDQRMIRRRR